MGRASSPVRIAALGFAALAIAFGVGAIKLGLRREGVPGPGLLPLLASLALLPLALSLAWRPGRLADARPLARVPLLAIGALAAFAAVLPWAGFVLSTVALLVAWIVVFHERSAAAAVTVAVALTAGTALLFRGLLGVPLPLWPAWGP